MNDFEKFTVGRFGTKKRRRPEMPSLVAIGIFFCVGIALVAFGYPDMISDSGGRDVSGSRNGSDLLGDREAGGAGGSTQPTQPTQYSTQNSEDSEPVSVLLLGLDGREGASEEQAKRSDTIMLAHTYPDTGEIKLLSIPRDLIVEGVGPESRTSRINSAYAYGGADATIDAVEDLTGTSVDHYVAADFEGFEESIDALGGVEVQVEHDYLASKGIPSGEQVLDGKEALLYARYRETPKGDLGRIERQQKLLESLRSQALSWDSIRSAPGIIRSLNDHVETDMGVRQMISLGRALSQSGEDGKMESEQLQVTPVTLPDGREVLVPSQEQNAEIQYELLR